MQQRYVGKRGKGDLKSEENKLKINKIFKESVHKIIGIERKFIRRV